MTARNGYFTLARQRRERNSGGNGYELDEVLREADVILRRQNGEEYYHAPTGRRQFLDAIAYIHRDRPSAALSFVKKQRKLYPGSRSSRVGKAASRVS